MTKVWPPSDESMPFLVAFLIGVFLLMYSIFFSSRKETKYVKEAKEEKRAKCAALPNCSSPGPHERESVGHPTMADLPPSFVQEVLMSRPGMREEMEIYTEALALADCGPRRRVRIPAFARRESPA